MASNRLILRTVNSPWVTPIPDLTKGVVLTHVELDNNFIYLKGEVIENVEINDGITTLYKINGNNISFDNGQNNLVKAKTYTLGLSPTGDTITKLVNLDPNGIIINDKTNYIIRVKQDNFDLIYTFASGKGNWGGSLSGGTPVVDSDFILLNSTTASTASPLWEVGTALYSIQAINDSGTQATNLYAVAEGFNTLASGYASHTEGLLTIASGNTSHAEGRETRAIGNISHAEGYRSTASGDYSHAEGLNTLASGRISHAEGSFTTASGNYSYVSGKGFNNNNQIISSGNTSFGHFEQTSPNGNIGVYGNNSAILGGIDHNINSNANNSAIIGGGDNLINSNTLNSVILGGSGLTATQSNTTYVPQLNVSNIQEEFTGNTSLTIDNQGYVKKFETNNFSRTIYIDSDDLDGCITCSGSTLQEQIAQYVNTLNYNKLNVDTDIWIEFHDISGVFTYEFDEQFG